jgi:hypothetical protein
MKGEISKNGRKSSSFYMFYAEERKELCPSLKKEVYNQIIE